MPVIGRPPILAIGHQRLQILLQRTVIERVEGFAIIEVLAHRVGIAALGLEDVDLQLVGPPVAIGPPEQVARAAIAMEGAAAHFTGLGIHIFDPLSNAKFTACANDRAGIQKENASDPMMGPID